MAMWRERSARRAERVAEQAGGAEATAPWISFRASILKPGGDGRRVVVRAADVAGHLLLLLLLLLPPLLLLAQLAAMRPGLPVLFRVSARRPR
jgi:hypothetical protein